jgi:hypothetical protein
MTEEARVKVLCMELGLRVGVIGEGGLSLLVPLRPLTVCFMSSFFGYTCSQPY